MILKSPSFFELKEDFLWNFVWEKEKVVLLRPQINLIINHLKEGSVLK